MKRDNITAAIDSIDDNYIAEAAEYRPAPSHRGRLIGIGIAACLAAGIAVGAYALNRNTKPAAADSISSESIPSESKGLLPRPYKAGFSTSESAVIYPWEYLTEAERYSEITFEGRKYRIGTTRRTMEGGALGKSLGSCTGSGYDEYTEQSYTKELEAFEIQGADTALAIAVKNGEGIYAFRSEEYAPPATLGELFEAYGLADKLTLGAFSKDEGYTSKDSFTLTVSKALTDKLVEFTDAKLLPTDTVDRTGMKCLTFRADCPELGIFNKALTVTEGGQLLTNCFEWGYVYEIGKERAAELITLAEQHSEPGEPPSSDIIGGKVTEMGDGYIKLDDSVLCEDESDGKVFTLMTEDPWIKRCIEFSVRPKAGDIVAVYYDGEIGDDLIIKGAYELTKAQIGDGGLYINE